MNDNEDMNSNDFYDDLMGDSITKDTKPQDMNYETFNLRNNPERLLDDLQLLLLRAHRKAEKDKDTGMPTGEYKIQRIPGTTPIVNKQGVKDILTFVQMHVNNHTVQAYIPEYSGLNVVMRFISDEMTLNFWSKRHKWDLAVDDVNPLIQRLSNLIFLFLSRTVGDKERMHYSESYKEETRREVRPEAKKKSVLDAAKKWFQT